MPDHHAEPAAEADNHDVSTAATRPAWSRWTPFVAPAIALVALVIAIAAWLRAEPPTYSDQQKALAKTNVCSAYKIVHQGVVENTHLADAPPNDRFGHLAVAANARLALLGGGGYLRDHVDSEPATPADIAQAVNSMGDTIEHLGAAYLAGAGNDVLDPLRHSLDSDINNLNKLCT